MTINCIISIKQLLECSCKHHFRKLFYRCGDRGQGVKDLPKDTCQSGQNTAESPAS